LSQYCCSPVRWRARQRSRDSSPAPAEGKHRRSPFLGRPPSPPSSTRPRRLPSTLLRSSRRCGRQSSWRRSCDARPRPSRSSGRRPARSCPTPSRCSRRRRRRPRRLRLPLLRPSSSLRRPHHHHRSCPQTRRRATARPRATTRRATGSSRSRPLRPRRPTSRPHPLH